MLKPTKYIHEGREYTHLLGRHSMPVLFVGHAINRFIADRGNINYSQFMVLMLAADICDEGMRINRTRYRGVHKQLLLFKIPLQYADYSFSEFVRLGLMEKAIGGWKLTDEGLRLVLLWERYIEDYFSVDGRWVVYGNKLPRK